MNSVVIGREVEQALPVQFTAARMDAGGRRKRSRSCGVVGLGTMGNEVGEWAQGFESTTSMLAAGEGREEVR